MAVALLFFAVNDACAQNPDAQDTFFLAKKKGLLGRFGKSISRGVPAIEPEQVANPFFRFKGKIIRSIEVYRLDFEYDIYDTTRKKTDFGTRLAKKFHRNSTEKLIRNNIFFKEGTRLYPLLLADNERYLRELVYIKDARILVDYSENSTDSVDVVVMTKDIFSIGARINISSVERGRVEVRDENMYGSGSKLAVSGYYDKVRNPPNDYGVEFVKRNIKGSFIDWTIGYQGYRLAFNSSRNEEATLYTRVEKPLVTPYIPTTGALEAAVYTTRNNYVSDSLYNSDVRYQYYTIDGWFGYSLDNRRAMYNSREIKVHRFMAIRGFMQHFTEKPQIAKTSFDYRFSNFAGGLVSINFFRQVFYKTNFIYGFGRSEDVPEGFNISLNSGFVNKQGRNRPYGGFDVQVTNIRDKGFYSSYTFRAGGYFYKKRFEDVDMLANADYFTRLGKISNTWFHRGFISVGITAQANPVLNTPLFLSSEYGLPYFSNYMINADLRATVKGEGVFYNTKKVLGFRFAPFVFADASALKPSKENLGKTELYGAVGGGVRTRNENLVFGTVELRGYYFPRTNGDMRNWKVEINTNIRFRYRSNFISRPDFVIAN